MSYTTIRGLLTGIADAVRAKDGTSALIQNQDLPARIAAIKTGMSWEEWIDDDYDPDVVLTGTHTIGAYKMYRTSIDTLTGSGIVTINSNAFNESGVKSVNLPNATGVLGYQAFRECDNLKSVVLGVTSTDSYIFCMCEELETVSFPNCTSFEAYSFYKCPKLSSVNAPQLDNIYMGAFMYCSALKNFTFHGVMIARDAFTYSGLETIHLTNRNVVQAAANAFPSSLSAIYVPADLVETYKMSTNWSQYANIIYPEV